MELVAREGKNWERANDHQKTQRASFHEITIFISLFENFQITLGLSILVSSQSSEMERKSKTLGIHKQYIHDLEGPFWNGILKGQTLDDILKILNPVSE